MKQPTQEQLRDPEWWDQNEMNSGSIELYLIWEDGKFKKVEWCPPGAILVIEAHETWERYQRPTKPAAPEWNGEGLPPVGCECEYRLGGSANWHPCRVKAVAYEQGAIIECDCEFGEQYVSLFGGQPVQFRPIRTKAERDLDELATEIWGAIGGTKEQAYHAANRVVAAGWCKGE